MSRSRYGASAPPGPPAARPGGLDYKLAHLLLGGSIDKHLPYRKLIELHAAICVPRCGEDPPPEACQVCPLAILIARLFCD